MKHFYRRVVAVCAASTLLLSGCTPLTQGQTTGDEHAAQQDTQTDAQTTPQSKSTFGLAYYANEKINPVLSVSRINRILCEALYEGLFVLDSNFTPQPMLCDTYSGDGVNWTFTLKQGVKFWSGNDLRASDVVYSYQTAMKNSASPYYNRLQQVQSISASDDRTVHIQLKSPNTSLLRLLDVPVFRQGTEGEVFSDGSGPYQPQSDGSIRWLVPFTGWREGVLTVFPKIDLISTTRADAVVTSFETGDISMTRADRISATPATFKGAAEVYQTRTTDLHYLGVNYGRTPYQIGAVRQAISYALDRDRLCSTQLQSFADPAVLPVNPQPAANDKLSYSLTQNDDKALALLAATGIKDTNGDGVLEAPTENATRSPLQPVILVNAENTFKVAVVQQIISDLQQIGIRATMESVPFDEYQNRIRKGEYDLYYGETILTADFDLRPLIAQGGTLNLSGYASAVTDSLLTQERAATGDSLQAAQSALYSHLLVAMPIVPIAFTRGQVITRSALIKGYAPAPFDMFYGIKDWKAG